MNRFIFLGFVILVADVVILIDLDSTLHASISRPMYTATDVLEYCIAVFLELFLLVGVPGLCTYLFLVGSGM